ncbi:hypothetical protein HMSSN036_80020 [Paenibacillus macerans]|nr:hypothetical protein HMSSN036_80020 [Paenibacillus macerans]
MYTKLAYKGGRLISRKGVMPVAIKDTLMIMISFGALIIALLTLVLAIIVAINQNIKK